MKVTIEFNLPEDEDDYELMIKCKEKYLEYEKCLEDIRSYIRSTIKYSSEPISDQSMAYLEQIRYFLPSLD